MKKFDFKTRLQWGWFKAALFGAALAFLIAPAAGEVFGTKDTASQKNNDKDNPVTSFINSISFGSKVKVMINGDVVALAKSKEAGEEAFKAARLAYNAKGVRMLDIDVTYQEVDKEKDGDTIKGLRVLSGDKLSDTILKSFDTYADAGKDLAYTMRIDDYTVTVNNIEDLISILEDAQSAYDVDDSFKVELNPPASRNTTMYEVGVTMKSEEESSGDKKNSDSQNAVDNSEEQVSTEPNSENTTEVPAESTETPSTETPSTEAPSADVSDETQAEGGVNPIEPAKVGLTGENSSEQTAGNEGNSDGQNAESMEATGNGQNNQPAKGQDNQTSEKENEEQQSAQSLGAEDGIKYVGFAEKIQVVETYVGKDQIKDKDTVYNEITTKNDEASVYVVEPGDCLSVIAEKNNMTVDQIKELNPGIESDDNLYYDDRLNIQVPRAAVQILVEKQETYQEQYNEDIVYEDDDSMYIGETEVVQEGSQGTHIVTDLVTYKDDIECDREQLDEKVEVAAVAQIVKRGTKSKPTYMYPVTNWVVTSTFGSRWGRMHEGIDVGVPVGTTVRASRAGRIVTAGWVGGYGNCVIIDHGDGVCTRYGHLSQITTSVGQYVDQGSQIALSGNTGRSTGPHLHFEIRVNGTAVDPAPYLEGR